MGGGTLIGLLMLAAIASIILGMGMPTVGVYILLATLIAPALVEMKIPPMAAHMFIMYYGCLSMITPPVAIGAFAAANLAGADPMRTGYRADGVRLDRLRHPVPVRVLRHAADAGVGDSRSCSTSSPPSRRSG